MKSSGVIFALGWELKLIGLYFLLFLFFFFWFVWQIYLMECSVFTFCHNKHEHRLIYQKWLVANVNAFGEKCWKFFIIRPWTLSQRASCNRSPFFVCNVLSISHMMTIVCGWLCVQCMTRIQAHVGEWVNNKPQTKWKQKLEKLAILMSDHYMCGLLLSICNNNNKLQSQHSRHWALSAQLSRLNKPKTKTHKLIYVCLAAWYLAFRYWNIVMHGNQSARKTIWTSAFLIFEYKLRQWSNPWIRFFVLSVFMFIHQMGHTIYVHVWSMRPPNIYWIKTIQCAAAIAFVASCWLYICFCIIIIIYRTMHSHKSNESNRRRTKLYT